MESETSDKGGELPHFANIVDPRIISLLRKLVK